MLTTGGVSAYRRTKCLFWVSAYRAGTSLVDPCAIFYELDTLIRLGPVSKCFTLRTAWHVWLNYSKYHWSKLITFAHIYCILRTWPPFLGSFDRSWTECHHPVFAGAMGLVLWKRKLGSYFALSWASLSWFGPNGAVRSPAIIHISRNNY
jgi:hypothetical protein